ncbi:unnamed protein product [Rhizoctonia solani]|uniref:Transmembrane protein n=1 Tax=Rhizoctonia solani TaxID=456999 RepID=A0A8H2XT51_9AGAM|nr:unnamed protein product [Rhizoctonia solani]
MPAPEEASKQGGGGRFTRSLANVRRGKIRASRKMTRPIGVTHSQGILSHICKYLIPILTVFLALFVLRSVPEACKLPVLSRHFHHCVEELDSPERPIVNPDFISLARLQSRLEYVVEDGASSSVVADNIKDSEITLRDLITQVEISSIARRDTLGRALRLFVKDAKDTGESLQEFSSRVWGAVDRVVSLNEHMLITLEDISSKAPSSPFDDLVDSFLPSGRETVAIRQKKMENLWLQGIGLLDKTLHELIHESQANVGFLQRLEETLNNIQDMVTIEEDKLRGEELALKQQWFNSEEQQSNSKNLGVLQRIKNDRRHALDHVQRVLVKLKQMSNDLDSMREGVASPMVIAGSSGTPVKAHINSIRGATERLLNGHTRMREIESEHRRKRYTSPIRVFYSDMRTGEDSTPFESENEGGDDWETNSGALQDEQNNSHRSPAPLPDKQGHKTPINMPEDMNRPTTFGAGRLRDAMVSMCNFRVVSIVSILYLVFFAPRLESPIGSLCNIPVLSGYSYCVRELDLPRRPIVTPDFIALAGLQSRLEQVMKDSAGSSKVAVDIKDSEMALRDLGTLVQNSALSNKDPLGRDLKLFVGDAKGTSESLQRFGSRVWGAVDRIISLNEHMLIRLESIPTGRRANKAEQKGMEDIWLQAIEALDKGLRKLIHEAQENLGQLQRLEERLENIEDMVTTEKQAISGQEQKLKRQWLREKLGMNEEKRQSHSASLELIEMVKDDRKRALRHVAEALFNLKQISNDLDDLREGVATPIIIADSSNVPIEVHIDSIRSATERLVNGQTRMRAIEDEYRREKFSE